MSGYRALAAVYDALSGNVDYKRRCLFVEDTFRENGIIAGDIVLDAGCGTGAFTAMLSKCGFDMIGVDLSCEMLGIAYSEHGDSSIRFLQQDLRMLDLYGTVKGVCCMQDTLNHFTYEDFCAVLSRFSLFTEPGGTIVFDLNTEYKHKCVLGDNDFVFDTEDGLCVWRNEYDGQGQRTRLTVDVFCREGGLYRRMTDEFYEYAFSEDEVRAALDGAGLEPIKICDGDSFEELGEASERMLFVAKKR